MIAFFDEHDLNQHPVSSDTTKRPITTSARQEPRVVSLIPLVQKAFLQLSEKQEPSFRFKRTDRPVMPPVHAIFRNMAPKEQDYWKDHGTLAKALAGAVRRVLVDNASRRFSFEQDYAGQAFSLQEITQVWGTGKPDFIAIDNALNELQECDQRLSQIVELRFFGAMTFEEIAEVLNLDLSTVIQNWKLARAWLYNKLKADQPDC